MGHHAELADLDLPEFGLPTVEPAIPADEYRFRMEELYARARELGYDVFVVYADREHFANLTYLTGYDPRFEEALLVLNIDRKRAKSQNCSSATRASATSKSTPSRTISNQSCSRASA